MIHVLLPLSAILLTVHSAPTSVFIASDASNSVHLGPYDQTRFDLVEEFHPLQTASAANAKQIQEMKEKKRAFAATQAEISVILPLSEVNQNGETESTTPAPLRLSYGDWSSWSEWSPCANGERFRMRMCVARKPALKTICHGDARQTQRCFSSQEVNTQLTQDPWMIEREITRDFVL